MSNNLLLRPEQNLSFAAAITFLSLLQPTAQAMAEDNVIARKSGIVITQARYAKYRHQGRWVIGRVQFVSAKKAAGVHDISNLTTASSGNATLILCEPDKGELPVDISELKGNYAGCKANNPGTVMAAYLGVMGKVTRKQNGSYAFVYEFNGINTAVALAKDSKLIELHKKNPGDTNMPVFLGLPSAKAADWMKSSYFVTDAGKEKINSAVANGEFNYVRGKYILSPDKS